jgi:hypothetical protein
MQASLYTQSLEDGTTWSFHSIAAIVEGIRENSSRPVGGFAARVTLMPPPFLHKCLAKRLDCRFLTTGRYACRHPTRPWQRQPRKALNAARNRNPLFPSSECRVPSAECRVAKSSVRVKLKFKTRVRASPGIRRHLAARVRLPTGSLIRSLAVIVCLLPPTLRGLRSMPPRIFACPP